jgi:hypothetical protein
MVAAAGGLIRDASQISLGKPFDFPGVDSTFLTPGLSFLLSSGSIQGNGFKKGCFIMVTNIGLWSANLRIYLR